jgi:hypothetical protein
MFVFDVVIDLPLPSSITRVPTVTHFFACCNASFRYARRWNANSERDLRARAECSPKVSICYTHRDTGGARGLKWTDGFHMLAATLVCRASSARFIP